MTDQQAGSGSPEPKSYDVDMMADVRGAFDEVSKAEPVVEDKAPAPAPKEPPAETAKTEAARDDQGRFVKADEKAEPKAELKVDAKVEAKPAEKAPEVKAAEQPAVDPKQPQPASVAGNPPGGFSVKTKADWEKITTQFPSLVADILKREDEVSKGFAQFEGMRELRPYMDMARTSGTTLKAALDNYVGIENLLRQDTIKGILHIAGNVGYTPQRLAMELAQYGGQPNGYQNAQQPGAQTSAIDPNLLQPWLNPLQQEIAGMKSLLQKQQDAERARQMTAVNTVLDRFVSDPAHRYYQNVETQMVKLLDSGVVARSGDYATDLKAAYDLACRMDPEIGDLLVNERIAKTEADRAQKDKEAAEKAKLASRSITGSPSSGPAKDDSGVTGDSVEDDVRRAYRAHAA